MVEPADVIAAYFWLLGRKPESQNVIKYQCNTNNVKDLRENIMNSDEYILRERKRLSSILSKEDPTPLRNSSVMISSFRRSGTHLLIDRILSLFPGVSSWFELANAPLAASLVSNKKCSVAIFKTHQEAPDSFLNASLLNHSTRSFYQDICDNAAEIYIVRDGRDVLTSLYKWEREAREPSFSTISKNMPFHDYLTSRYSFNGFNRIEYWCYCVNNWLESRPNSIVRFEDILGHPFLPNNILRKLENLRHYAKDLQPSLNLPPTGLHPNGGRIGAFRELWNEECERAFCQFGGQKLNDLLGYNSTAESKEISLYK